MLDSVLSVLSPYYCYECQKPPQLLCNKCKNNNIKNYNTSNIIPFYFAEKHIEVKFFSLRVGSVKDLVDGLKFERQKNAYKIIAKILNECFPASSSNDEILTTIPTSFTHKRERGYDHMKLICKEYSRLSKIPFVNLLEGNRNYSQHSKNYVDRQKLSKDIYNVKNNNSVDKNLKIILIDDILTTGATMKSAYKALKIAGYHNIECRVFLYQPFTVD